MTTYCEERLAKLGITEELNHIEGIVAPGDKETACPNWQMFTSDKDDNIVIHYTTPAGEKIVYPNNAKNTKYIDFCRIRLKVPKGDQKYSQPAGTESYPFSTPKIIETYKAGEKVKTLFVVEGEFKAVSMFMIGLPTFGLPGISNYKKKGDNVIHPFISDYIERCRVENVVVVYDADYKQIKYEEDKDLATRLYAFYNALNTFNELLKPYNVNLYFSPLKTTLEFKGIDDLLCDGNTDKDIVKSELTALNVRNNNRQYIDTYQLTGMSSIFVQSIFYLDRGGVQRLYDDNIEQLQDKEFVFKKEKYSADEKGTVHPSYEEALKQYIRVASDYYKIGYTDYGNDVRERILIPMKTQEIKRDFGAKFLELIPKYDNFVNNPDNTETYQQSSVTEYKGTRTMHYNIYSPMTHTPKEGKWDTIDKMMHHIFNYKNKKGEALYDFGIDFFQMLYCEPKQHLPILCLVSKERGTGKTTLLNLLQNIFSTNMVITDSDRIASQFNSGFAGKLIVAVDESRIAVDKPLVTERLKMLATNDHIQMESKGKNAQSIRNYSKLIMCSNETKDFVKIDLEENRYAVIEVSPIPEADYDYDMVDKMTEEIPAFLYHLANREMFYQRESRLYFKPSVYETKALDIIKERTQNSLVRTIQDVVKEQFYRQRSTCVKLSRNMIYKLVCSDYKYKVQPTDISDKMKDMGYRTGNPTNCKYILDEALPLSAVTEKAKAYEIEAEDWLSEEDYKELMGILAEPSAEDEPEQQDDDDQEPEDEELPF